MERDDQSSMEFDHHCTRQVLRHYVPMFRDRSPVLDLGCGRGEILGLLEEVGVKAEGVDSDDVMAFLHADPAPGPFQGVFCAHVLEHLTPDQVAHLLAGVRRVLAPGGRFVAVSPNPGCYAVLTHDFWRDPTHVRLYDAPLIEFFCRQAGLQVEASDTNPASNPGPPPALQVVRPVAHPPLGGLVEQAMQKVKAGLGHHGPAGRLTAAHDAAWAYELGHVVEVLAERLQEATEALSELHRAHDKLVWGMYESNESYVVAWGSEPGTRPNGGVRER